MKIGIFGGTFNPVHKGHVNLSEFYKKNLKLDRLFIIPSNIPPHKDAPDLLNKVDRYNICRLAFSKIENVEVLDIEIRQEGAVRTVDTLKKLIEIHKTAEFYLIIGGDLFKTFKEWRDYEVLLKNAVICVGARTNDEMEVLREIKKDLEKDGAEIILQDLPVLEMSSTEIRNKMKNGQEVRQYLDEKVYRYIKTTGLYGLNNTDVKKYQDLVNTTLKTKRRKEHSFNVGKEALTLGIINEVDERTIYIAGILHDILKETEIKEVLKWPGYSDIISQSEIKDYKALWHAYFGARYIKINLPELPSSVVDMVRYHPTSRVEATLEEKIIYLADLIEFNRNYKNINVIKKETEKDFLSGYKVAVLDQIKHLVDLKKPIAPVSIAVYNSLLLH